MHLRKQQLSHNITHEPGEVPGAPTPGFFPTRGIAPASCSENLEVWEFDRSRFRFLTSGLAPDKGESLTFSTLDS